MKGHEYERKIRLPIQMNEKREFTLVLLDEATKVKLDGCDSEAIITLLEDDSENFVGFSQPLYKASVGQSSIKVTVKRFDGAPDEIGVTVGTVVKRSLF